jgi:hypothetical protein
LDSFAGFIHGPTLIGSQEISPGFPGLQIFRRGRQMHAQQQEQ